VSVVLSQRRTRGILNILVELKARGLWNMVYVPPKEERKKRYVASTGGVPASYGAGIARTNDWQAKAVAGQGLFEEQMRKPEVLARRVTGLQKTSDAVWKQKASTLGVQRIAAGMVEGADRQANNYEPIAEALRSLTLADKTSDPMQNIDQRVKPVVAAARRAAGK